MSVSMNLIDVSRWTALTKNAAENTLIVSNLCQFPVLYHPFSFHTRRKGTRKDKPRRWRLAGTCHGQRWSSCLMSVLVELRKWKCQLMTVMNKTVVVLARSRKHYILEAAGWKPSILSIGFPRLGKCCAYSSLVSKSQLGSEPARAREVVISGGPPELPGLIPRKTNADVWKIIVGPRWVCVDMMLQGGRSWSARKLYSSF